MGIGSYGNVELPTKDRKAAHIIKTTVKREKRENRAITAITESFSY